MHKPKKGNGEAAQEVGQAATPPPNSLPPLAFGRYEVQGLVGEGSMGRVYRAFDPMAKRVVAIKTVKTEYLTSAKADDYLKRFRREAQAAGNLAHSHLVTIFDVGEDYFVMELLEGTTLRAALQKAGRFEVSEALRILGAVAEGLDHAHSKGVIHRDIKPSNIMLLPDGRPKIMDFGVAHLASTMITSAGDFVGSPSYMAPEQITSSKASPRTDLFSLAVVGYEMITGKQPFPGESIAEIVYGIVNRQAAPPSARVPSLPARYDDVFQRALAKDPSVRYPNATAFVAALGRRSADEAASAPPVDPPLAAPPAAPAVGDVTTHDLKDPLPEGLKDAARSGVARPWKWHLPSRRLLLILGTLAMAGALGVVLRRPARGGPLSDPAPRGALGAIEVATDPLGAQVWVDGTEAGQSPLNLAEVRPGRHSIRVALLGFSSAEVTLDVPPGAFGVPLRFTLQPVSALLEIRSEPEGAQIFVDGNARGTTPVQVLPLPPGKHAVELTRNGFRPWVQSVQANAGERIPLLGRLQPQRRAVDTMAHLRALGWVHEGDFLEPGPDVVPPVKISGESAPYPESARKLKLQGTVTVEVTISERGDPTDLHVVESAGELLDTAVLAAVRTWRWSPAQKNGVKVRTRLRVEQNFENPH